MKVINIVALILIIIGGLNWGLVGFFEYNLVDALFGEGSALARSVYGLVGIAALYKLIIATFVHAGIADKEAIEE